ncbi:hypothetical protein EJG51_014395 [Undibacterium piscinae]|uniref:histidine kinase n=1 Tax=Undibacterium piscinae TaxID=2495591 RepID=A0A6M4A7X1_9BURK|nr:hypothetical protein EJG51_014395 [Undibacterium piscinae]
MRTPLTSVKGALGLVVGGVFGTMPEKMHGLMVTALHNCQTLNNLINDILDMEKTCVRQVPFTSGVTGYRAIAATSD